MWMSKNRLKLNADKTRLIWLGTRQQLAKLTVTQLRLTSSVVEFNLTVTDLSVVLVNQLFMQAQVAAVCRSCLYQLRQLCIAQQLRDRLRNRRLQEWHVPWFNVNFTFFIFCILCMLLHCFRFIPHSHFILCHIRAFMLSHFITSLRPRSMAL